MNEKLTLNDGTKLNGYFIETKTRLFLYVYDMQMDEVFNLLYDPEKTKKIVSERGGEKTTVKGYKILMSISVETSNMISASLKK